MNLFQKLVDSSFVVILYLLCLKEFRLHACRTSQRHTFLLSTATDEDYFHQLHPIPYLLVIRRRWWWPFPTFSRIQGQCQSGWFMKETVTTLLEISSIQCSVPIFIIHQQTGHYRKKLEFIFTCFRYTAMLLLLLVVITTTVSADTYTLLDGEPKVKTFSEVLTYYRIVLRS